MERGLAGGMDYKMTFPQQQQQMTLRQPNPTEGNIDDYIPEAVTTGLANREGLVKDYYNKARMLKDFAHAMSKQGINVFEPDFTQDGGGEVYNTFQQMQANLLYAANALGNEQEFEKQTRDLELRGLTRRNPNVDTQGLYYSNVNNFTPTGIDPLVAEANKELGDTRYTQGDSNRLNQAIRDPRIKHFQEQIQKDPQNRLYYERQIQALLQNVPQAYPPDLIPTEDKSRNKHQFQVELLKKYTNLKNGVWSPNSFSKVIDNGKVFLKNEEGKGDLMGKYDGGRDNNGNVVYKDKVVDSWLKDPETGKVFIKFTDPKLPLEEVSNLSGDAVARTFVSNNTKFGSVDKMLEAAASEGYMSEGSSIDEALMPENFEEIRTGVNRAGIGAAAKINQEKESIKKKLSGLKGAKLYANSESITLPDGRVLEIARHKYSDDNDSKKFFIRDFDNFQSELHSDPDSEAEDLQSEGLSAEDVIKYLSKLGYFNQFLNAAETEIDPDI